MYVVLHCKVYGVWLLLRCGRIPKLRSVNSWVRCEPRISADIEESYFADWVVLVG